MGTLHVLPSTMQLCNKMTLPLPTVTIMPRRKHEPTGQEQLSFSLKLETTDRNRPNVDAADFFFAAEKWLRALKIFAKEQGEHVKWEIVDLRKSSALMEVQPVKVKSGKPAPALVRQWEQGLKKIEETGKPVPKFTPESLSALHDFVFSIPTNTIVSFGNGPASERHKVTPLTQRRVEQAVTAFPPEPKKRICGTRKPSRSTSGATQLEPRRAVFSSETSDGTRKTCQMHLP